MSLLQALLLSLLSMVFAFALPVKAQVSGQSITDQTGESAQHVEELIEVLEDPQRREAFIEKLDALQEGSAEDTPADPLEISEVLQLDQRVGEFLKDYVSLLSSSDLKAGSVGKLVALVLISAIFIVLFLLNRWLSRLFDRQLHGLRNRLKLGHDRFSSVFSWQRHAGSVVAVMIWLYALIVVVFNQAPGQSIHQAIVLVIQTTVAVLLVALLFLLIWEFINAVIEALAENSGGLSSNRAATLLPVARNVLTFILVLLSSLVILSEIGIDVMPLLAGAGVLGIAIGFGAQTLVKDFLTGFTIIIEDLLQMGDVVTVAGRTGFVTHISMRKLELRSLEGTVHTIPFSAIDIVDNLTKDFSYYMLEVGVAYRESTDEVIECLLSVDEELRASEEFGDAILEPLEVLGVDAFADSAVIVKARTKTQAREKWRVGREFNRRIKLAFDARDIEIPFPHQTIYFGVDKEGNAPPIPPSRESVESKECS